MYEEMKFLFLSLLVGLGCGQDCSEVSTGLQIILDPCNQSPTECVEAVDLDGLSEVFCMPEAEMQYQNFQRCTGNFSDQVFGALCCSGSKYTGVGGACTSGMKRCFETVATNNATEVFTECLCSQETSSLSCPSSTCKSALEELANDVGCCANSLIYTLYLDICMGAADNSLYKKDGLSLLFAACSVPFPATCLHPFSIPSGSPSMGEASIAWPILTTVVALINVFY